ncbi:MAG: hypothetical protein R2838_16470 [Caldilineaceae bacterium]
MVGGIAAELCGRPQHRGHRPHHGAGRVGQPAEIKVDSQDAYFARGTFHGLQIDFLLTENPLFRTVQESYATRLAFLEREIPIATVHGLLLLKLYGR